MSKHKPHGPFGEKVYICRNVFDKAAPILFVYHEHHGDWQMLCGIEPHDSITHCLVVHAERVLTHDPSVNELANLPTGQMATRETAESTWQRNPIP